jgi:hypothetical protein
MKKSTGKPINGVFFYGNVQEALSISDKRREF